MIRRWTSEEIAKLKSMAQRHSGAKIAQELGRGFPALRVKAHKLGISLRLKDEKRGAFMSTVRETKSPAVTKFIAYAVDLSGTALARYDLAASDQDSAEQEAGQYLEQHPIIEVWSDDHRRVARLVAN